MNNPINNLVPMTKNFQRTDKTSYGVIKYTVKMKDMQRIEERVQYDLEGKLKEVYIQFSDETSRKPSSKNPEEVITYRDEITYNWSERNLYGEIEQEPYERVNWSTGWQEDMKGKMKEAEIRSKALKYFEKRKNQLLSKES